MKKKKGFTLLELLFVMVIIAVLAIVGYNSVLNYYQKAKKETFLTDAKKVYRESSNLYSAEYYKNNKLSVISTDEGYKSLDLDSETLRYCIYLKDGGDVESYKITNGTYYIEGTELSEFTSDNAKYGTFDSFSCEYELDESDLLEEKTLSIDFKYMKALKIIAGVFVGAIILGLIFRNKNER